MAVNVEENAKRARRSRLPAGPVGARLVVNELVRHGCDAQLAGRLTFKYDVLVRLVDSPPKPVQVRTVHMSPWYVRSANFFGTAAYQVTVYVLLGVEKASSARFFIARNSDLAGQLRQPSNWDRFGFMDIKSLREYEDNWTAITNLV